MAKIIDYNATVVSKKLLNDYLLILEIKPDDQPYHFKPGQYASIGVRGTSKVVEQATNQDEIKLIKEVIQRAYSIASSNTSPTLEFYLALVAHGQLTPRLFALAEGDRLYVSKKAVGIFTLEKVPPTKHLLLMSTGTGLAPYISMLRSQFDWSLGQKVILMHGVRHEKDLGYRSELENLARTQKDFFYIPVLSAKEEVEPTWNGMRGYLQNLIFSPTLEEQTQIAITPENIEVFICGNPAMIEASIEKLKEKDFILAKGRTPGTIHIEEYW